MFIRWRLSSVVLVLTASGAQRLVCGFPCAPVPVRTGLEMERICDHSVHDRKGAQHQEVQDREQGSGKHVPEALSEFDKSFHATKEGGEAWWSCARGRGSEEAILARCTRAPSRGEGMARGRIMGLAAGLGEPVYRREEYLIKAILESVSRFQNRCWRTRPRPPAVLRADPRAGCVIERRGAPRGVRAVRTGRCR